ncbi:septal ring lytic transglycosylase RlpA family protein [Balneatrix alpica]|uniref:Endolytic peptidoglycan transglycosylase RlpA n=1 Tax=Balneatrix alpica TaxID=75684 RepID=A0ABV5ZCY9_9GAMM|nr:septal ring lytic transglycosylase RlpA family protein [Balneatrix alpica]
MRLSLLFVTLLALVLSGCSSTPSSKSSGGRYAMDKDRGPSVQRDVSLIPDAEPQVEPYSKWGNRNPYQVWGKSYNVLPSHIGYRKDGIASWYGEKFHGHKTSNGELYDLYGMTAAHKSLPIPSYVRVTNLDNGRSVIVRVNDRGPFHDDREIDLSYAAAAKLGYADKGTARVRVEGIDAARWQREVGSSQVAKATAIGSTGITAEVIESRPVEQRVSHSVVKPTQPQVTINKPQPVIKPATPTATVNPGTGDYLQVAAFSSEQAAQQLQQRVKVELGEGRTRVFPVNINGQTFYRVKIGPLSSGENIGALESGLLNIGLGQPHLVHVP